MVINQDLMNNHQSELADQLSSDGYLYQCVPETLTETLETLNSSKLNAFPKPNASAFANFLDSIIDS